MRLKPIEWRPAFWVWIVGALSAYALELAHLFVTASKTENLDALLPGVSLGKALVTVVTPRTAWELLGIYLACGLLLGIVASRFKADSPARHVGLYVTLLILLRWAGIVDDASRLSVAAGLPLSIAAGYFATKQVERNALVRARDASAFLWVVWVNLAVFSTLAGVPDVSGTPMRILSFIVWMSLGALCVFGLARLPRLSGHIENRGQTYAISALVLVIALPTTMSFVSISGSSALQMVMGLEGGNKVSRMQGDIRELSAELRAREETWRSKVQPMSTGASRPNIILVVIDTLRADAVGAYNGGRTDTPFLDQLASEGALFENVYSTSPWTLAGHGSMFTGTFPSIHGANYDTLRLNGTTPTLAQLVSWSGYETAGFATNCWLNYQTNMSSGFDHFINSCGFKQLARIDSLRKKLRDRTLPHLAADLVRSSREGDDPATEPTEVPWIYTAIESWKPKEPDRPYFLFVNIVDPHAPYEFDPELRPRIPRRINLDTLRKKVTPPMRYFAGEDHFRPVEIESLRKVYEASVATADRRVRDVFQLLEAKELLKNAIVVLTSDHGEYLGEYGQFHHFFGVHEPVIRIPLIIKYARFFEPGTRVTETAQIIDVLPTILEMARIRYEHEGRVLGRSLTSRPEMEAPSRPIIAEMRENRLGLRRLERVTDDPEILARYSGNRYSVTESGYHYVFNEIDGSGKLYRLDESGGEGEDVTEQEPERARRMHQIVTDWLDTSSRLAELSFSEPGVDVEEFPEEFKRQLEALGYVDASSDGTEKKRK